MPNPNRPEQGSRPDWTRDDLDAHTDERRTKPTTDRDMPDDGSRSHDQALAWTYSCASLHEGCAFQVRSDDPDEVVRVAHDHLETVHHENLHPQELLRNQTEKEMANVTGDGS